MSKYFVIKNCDAAMRRRIQLLAFITLALSLAVIYLKPVENLFLFLGIRTVNGCPLYTFFGIPCPMCGMGRVFSAITDFHITKTFYYNPSGLFIYLLFGIIFGSVIVLSFRNKKITLTNEAKKMWYIPLILLVIVWALNILYGHHEH